MSVMPTFPENRLRSPGAPGERNYRWPFAIMTALFFLWGFMTVWNDLLIPRFKEAFHLNYFEAMLVQFSFFGAYAVGSLIYYAVSVTYGDPINRMGYKNGVVLALVISAVGSGLFYPAAVLVSYPLFLGALFVIGLGFALLQIAANPYVTVLGSERTAASRLNLSQAFNSLGTTVGPLIGGRLIFKVFTRQGMSPAESLKMPYLCASGVFLLIAVLFRRADLPTFTNRDDLSGGRSALRIPHTALGMVAIFMYVGGEVSVGSGIINFLGVPAIAGLTHQQASHFLSFYWGGLMVGRLVGAFGMSDLSPRWKRASALLVPLVAFFVVRKVPGVGTAAGYAICLGLLSAAFLFGKLTAPRLLALFGTINIVLLGFAVAANGETAMWAVLGMGLFCSVMWSNIFSLAIEGLGSLKNQASSLLVMAILGGAIIPPLQGAMADWLGVQRSFIVPMIAFAYVAFYGHYGHRVGRDATIRAPSNEPQFQGP